MGLIAEFFALKGGLPQHWRLFLTTGILGGFTTFSAFSLEAALLYERGNSSAQRLTWWHRWSWPLVRCLRDLQSSA